MQYEIIVEPEAFEDSQNKANIFLSELKSQINTLNKMLKRFRKSYYTDSENDT